MRSFRALAILLSFLFLSTNAIALVANGTAPATPAFATNGTATSNSALASARAVVKEAQASQKAYNIMRQKQPRLNKNAFATGATLKGLAAIANPADDPKVIKAAAMVAEADAHGNATAGGNSTVKTKSSSKKRQSASFWMEDIDHNGESPFAPSGYKVWRNVKDYGAKGDGVTDDTAAINLAISDQNRCGNNCNTTSVLGAVIYFPAGTYLVSSPIVQYFYTQFVGNPNDIPVIKAASSFVGLGVISSDVYTGTGPDGQGEFYINQSNFFRQIRNFIIDISSVPFDAGPAGLHWQVAQATSLQNIEFIQNNEANNNHVGLFMENGSGGFMSDLTFTGGSVGMNCGNQQFTTRNLNFKGCTIAVSMIWDWGWTWKGLNVVDSAIGIQVDGGVAVHQLHSVLIIDSSFTTTEIAVMIGDVGDQGNLTTITLDNVALENVPFAVTDENGAQILAGTSPGQSTISSWTFGSVIGQGSGSSGSFLEGSITPSTVKASVLLDNGKWFEQSKNQYESVPASSFVNVKDHGAAGDGKTDDTAALNSILSTFNGQIIFLPYGIYVITDTLFIPPGSRVVGEAWSQIMGTGDKFTDMTNPHVMVRVGNPGDTGDCNLQDLLFTVKGPTAGAVLLEWNIVGSSPGSAGMWDCHFRVGGAQGSDLGLANCPTSATNDPNCIAASLLLHLKGSAYLENVWLWVSDHDLEDINLTQVTVYAARGLLIEGPGPNWLYGTASEHSTLYQYQLSDAQNVFMGMIQTETPYYQPVPAAPAPFGPSINQFASDPNFADCDSQFSTTCAMAWALRLVGSSNVYVYGAGLYSFFSAFSTDCNSIEANDCQDKIFDTVGSGGVWVYNLATKASRQMVSPEEPGENAVVASDHQEQNDFVAYIAAWLGIALDTPQSTGSGSNSSSGTNAAPDMATIIPMPCTTVPPQSTFTLSQACATNVGSLPIGSNQNIPPGPQGCTECDFWHRITSTCCGTGGSVGNPVEIPAGVPLPLDVPLPFGFIPSAPLTISGTVLPSGVPLTAPTSIPAGTSLTEPLDIPAGEPLVEPVAGAVSLADIESALATGLGLANSYFEAAEAFQANLASADLASKLFAAQSDFSAWLSRTWLLLNIAAETGTIPDTLLQLAIQIVRSIAQAPVIRTFLNSTQAQLLTIIAIAAVNTIRNMITFLSNPNASIGPVASPTSTPSSCPLCILLPTPTPLPEPGSNSTSPQKRALTNAGPYGTGQIGQYGNLQLPSVPFCANTNNVFNWNSRTYPSTSQNPTANDPTDAGNIAAIGKWFRLGVIFDANAAVCSFGLVQEPTRQPALTYHTEHVYENHIAKDFLYWAFSNGLADCSLLQQIFGVPTPTTRQIDNIMAQFTWFDPTTNTPAGRGSEFFILEEQLNLLKGRFLDGRPLTDPFTAPTEQSDSAIIGRLMQGYAVMQYMNTANVMAAFQNVVQRIINWLTVNPNNPADVLRFLEWNQLAVYPDWQTAYRQFIHEWFTHKQDNILAWRAALVDELVNSADPNTQCALAKWGVQFSEVNYYFRNDYLSFLQVPNPGLPSPRSRQVSIWWGDEGNGFPQWYVFDNQANTFISPCTSGPQSFDGVTGGPQILPQQILGAAPPGFTVQTYQDCEYLDASQVGPQFGLQAGYVGMLQCPNPNANGAIGFTAPCIDMRALQQGPGGVFQCPQPDGAVITMNAQIQCTFTLPPGA